MTKQLWILNHYAQEPGGPGGTRHHALARHLKAQGWETVLIAASTELNTGRQRLAPHEKQRLESYEGVPFLWLRTPAYEGNGIGRIRNMLAYTLAALWPGKLSGLPAPDVIMGSSVHPLAAWAGLRLARRHKVPFVFEERDLWPESLIDMGRLRRASLLARLLLGLERHLYRHAAAVVTLLPGAAVYMQAQGVPSHKIHWISNGADLGPELESVPAAALAPASTLTPDLALNSGLATPQDRGDVFELMYFGAHGQANALEPILRGFAQALGDAQAPAMRLRLVGDGPLKPALMQLARELGLGAQAVFEPPVAKSGIAALAAQADACIVNLRDLPLYRYGISLNKLFDYMAAGKPVIFAGNPVNNPVRDADAGLCVPADSVGGIAAGILALARMPASERRAAGERGRQHVQAHYSYAHLAARLAAVLNGTLEHRAAHH